MSVFAKFSRTEVSALISVALFGMTILISAVGPAEAQGSITTGGDTLPLSVSHANNGYRA